jgi:thiol:disulfide interchange protein
MTGRRASDWHTVAANVLGFCVLGVAVWLHREGGVSEYFTLALIFLAGMLVRGESVVALFRKRR